MWHFETGLLKIVKNVKMFGLIVIGGINAVILHGTNGVLIVIIWRMNMDGIAQDVIALMMKTLFVAIIIVMEMKILKTVYQIVQLMVVIFLIK